MGLHMIRRFEGIYGANAYKALLGNRPVNWFIGFPALQVHKEGHFLASQESGYFRNLEYKEFTQIKIAGEV